MLVVISDLHFEEELSDEWPPLVRKPRERNVPAADFAEVVADIADLASRNRAQSLSLVLAGDIFDLHRTSLWFTEAPSEARPYVDCKEVRNTGGLEHKLCKILERIAEEREVKETLELISLFGQGKYHDQYGDEQHRDSVKSFFDDPKKNVEVLYLPGNHDRLVDATDTIRHQVCGLLGLPNLGGAPFGHEVLFDDPRVLIRHGHEYDHLNFSRDFEKDTSISSQKFAPHYSAPTFGDFVTVELAARLPYEFRKLHDPVARLQEPDSDLGRRLKWLYERLLEFDDVRPQSKVLEFLMQSKPSVGTEEEMWGLLRPVVKIVLETILEEERSRAYLYKSLQGLGLRGWFVSLCLRARLWKVLPKWMLGVCFGQLGKPPLADRVAAREDVFKNGQKRFVVAGHTHNPIVALADGAEPLDRFYVNTGTWRNVILSNETPPTFGRVKALTYAAFYAKSEEPPPVPGMPPKSESFDFRSGFKRRWRR